MYANSSELPYHHPYSQTVTIDLRRLAAILLDAGMLLAVALVAFEIFNFSTTRYALVNLLGDVSFVALRWATILAIAFVAIDFASLVRFFAVRHEGGNLTEAWYWLGAWLLGATMNAFTAWWATTIMLLAQGGSALGLLDTLPFVVAFLVWLTRVLFIGAFAVASGYLFGAPPSRS
ncbi:MAG: hypothetical protein PVH18_06580 [Chloroflexota bacterium]|jgi:hypothetical protein